LWRLLLWSPLRGWLLRLLVGCHNLLVMGRALITLLLTHVVVHEVILRRRLVIVMWMVLVIRLHVMLRRPLLMVRMLLLRMVMILMIVVIERCLWGAIKWWTSGTQSTRTPNCGCLKLAACEDYWRLMSIWWSTTAQMSHPAVARRICTLATPTATGTITIPHETTVTLLLGPIVGCVPNIHTIIRWESGVGHTLRRLTCCRGTAIMMRRNTLSESYNGMVTTGTGTRV
jgi:hypothetical protein